MGILKNFLKLKPKIQEAPEKKEECWYNNINEKVNGNKGAPLEGAALSGSNQFEYSVTKSNSMN